MRNSSRRRLVAICLAPASFLGCFDSDARPRENVRLQVAPVPRHARLALPGDALRGLSGLTRAPAGADFTFLAVAERLHHVVPLRVEAGTMVVLEPVPVIGVDPELDLEGVALLDDGLLAFATEADHARASERVLTARWSGGAADVVGVIHFDYEPWGLVPDRNRGLEGICAVDRRIVVASEMVDEEESPRWSPVGVYDLDERAWTPYRVFLTSDTGKLSGLACRARDDALEVTAIERHFDRLHIVRFTLGDASDAEARVLADLRPGFAQTPPNFEGIERLTATTFFLITDNDWRGVRGPTETIRWDEPSNAAEARAPEAEDLR